MTEQDRLNKEATDRALAYGRMQRQIFDAFFPTLAPKTEPTATKAEICARLDAGENYGEGTPLEAAIIAHVRLTGQPIEYTDPAGNFMILDDIEAHGGNA